MTNQQAKCLKHLAAYIHEANEKRKPLLGYKHHPSNYT